MYIDPRFSLSVASSISLCACPSTEGGLSEGLLLTPSKVPASLPAHTLTKACFQYDPPDQGQTGQEITDYTLSQAVITSADTSNSRLSRPHLEKTKAVQGHQPPHRTVMKAFAPFARREVCMCAPVRICEGGV